MSLVLSNKGKGMQSSSEQPLVGEERYVTTRITAAKETKTFAVMFTNFCRDVHKLLLRCSQTFAVMFTKFAAMITNFCRDVDKLLP